MRRHFISLIHKNPDSGYGLSFPDVPGVTAVADTLHELPEEGRIVLRFAFEDWQGTLPVARPLDSLREDAAFLGDAAGAVVAAVSPLNIIADAA